MKRTIQLLSTALLITIILSACTLKQPDTHSAIAAGPAVKYVLVIHGGAGTILRSKITPEKEAAYTAAHWF